MPKQRRGSIAQMIGQLSKLSLFAVAGTALIGIMAMGFVVFKTSYFLQLSHATSTTSAILEDGLEARLEAFRFRINGDPEIASEFTENVREVIEGNQIIREGGNLDSETLAALDQSDALISEYSAAFDKIVELRQPRNDLVASINETGARVSLLLTEIADSAYKDGDPTAAYYAGRAGKRSLRGMLFMERYLLANQKQDFDQAQQEFEAAVQGMDQMLTELQNPQRREAAQQAKASFQEFITIGENVFQLIEERNGYEEQMDQIGPQFIALVEDAMDHFVLLQDEIGTRLRQVGWISIALLTVLSLVVFIGTRRTSQRTALYIKTSMDEFVTEMTEVANGNLETSKKRPPDQATELARMAEALTIFRENTVQRNKMQKDQEKQQIERAAEQEAQRLRDEEAEAEAQKHIEQQRMALLKRLEDSVGSVVEDAARGDFKSRVTLDFEEESLRNMAEGINRLLENVDDGLGATSVVLTSLGKGDLTQLMDGEFQGAFKDLQNSTNDMIISLRKLMGDLRVSTATVSGSSTELRDTTDVLSRRAEQNAASLEETSAAVEELAASVKLVADNVQDANLNASKASDTAKSSSVVAADAAAAMSRISGASKEIAQVVTVINDIAFQINLLALNAGVEAARAGDAGRGFSVVASEVRQLAQRAGDAAREIDDVIGRSDQAVSEGVSKVTDAQESLGQISESVVDVSFRIEEISRAISEQVIGIGEINSAISQIDGNTQKQAASFEEITAATNVLSNEAEGLKRSAEKFNIGSEASLIQPTKTQKSEMPQSTPVRLAATTTGNLAEDLDGWSEF